MGSEMGDKMKERIQQIQCFALFLFTTVKWIMEGGEMEYAPAHSHRLKGLLIASCDSSG